MKKYSEKQIAYSNKKVREAQIKLKQKFFILIAFMALLVAGALYFSGDINMDQAFVGASVASVMGVIGNIDQAAEKDKKGKAIKSKLWILSSDQVDDTVAFPARAGRNIGTIPLKAGEYWHYIDSVEDTPEAKWKGAEGDIVTTTSNELSFVVGGMSDAVFNLLEDGAGKKFYVVWQPCGKDLKYLGGDGCKPLKFSGFEGGSTKDNTSTALTFKNESGYLWSVYTGSIQTQAPDAVAAAATEIPLTDNSVYTLQSGVAAAAVITGFSGVADIDINRVVTVKGLGGAFPSTITAAGEFLLIGGVTWTALLNAEITFKIFKSAAGVYTFVEVNNTRV